MSINLRVHKLHPDAKLPEYAHVDDSGMDVFAIEDVTIPGNHQPHFTGTFIAEFNIPYAVVNTGLSFEIPQGYEIQVRSKSGLAVKGGLFVLNSPGTIDEGYRGELAVILGNINPNNYFIQKGQKIAQIVLAPVTKATIIEMNTNETRQANGFGSTGL